MNSTIFDKEDLQYCFENTNESCYKTTYSSGLRVTLYIVLGLLIIFTVVGNLMVIVSIAYFQQLHSPTHFLLASLACADFSLGLIVLPFSTVRFIETCWYFGEIFCTFHCCLDVSFCLISVFHLCFISVDRYVAVNNPLIYTIMFTVPVSGTFIAVAWAFSLTYSFSIVYPGDHEEEPQELVSSLSCEGSCQLFLNKTWVVLSALLYFIPFSAIIVLYSRIFAVAKRQARMIEIMSNSTLSSHNYNDRVGRRERKAAKTLGIPVIAFFICWTPYWITIIMDAFINLRTPLIVFDILGWFAYSNSAINPLIYSLFYPWFRKAMKVIVSCKILRLDCSTMSLFSE